MFDVIENARMMVGTKAIATLSSGCLNALEYAKTRIQGADLTEPAKTAPRVPITHHPDVRRSLLPQKAHAAAEATVAVMFADLVAADPATGGDPRNIYKVALDTTRLLLASGDVIVGWLLLRQAEVATAKLTGQLSPSGHRFYEGKVAAAKFFAATFLPGVSSERAVAEAVSLDVMELHDAF